MSTSRSSSNVAVLETRYVWGATISEAMDKAQQLEWRGWNIMGNPAPMMWRGKHGTGVSITRVVYDNE